MPQVAARCSTLLAPSTALSRRARRGQSTLRARAREARSTIRRLNAQRAFAILSERVDHLFAGASPWQSRADAQLFSSVGARSRRKDGRCSSLCFDRHDAKKRSNASNRQPARTASVLAALGAQRKACGRRPGAARTSSRRGARRSRHSLSRLSPLAVRFGADRSLAIVLKRQSCFVLSSAARSPFASASVEPSPM